MASCIVGFIKCAPDGTEVVELLDGTDQTSEYFAGGVPWTGDPATLAACGAGGAMTPAQICAAIASECPGVADVAYDPATGEWTFTYDDGSTTVINTTVENFLNAAAFDPATNTLTFTLVDGTVVGPIDLSALVDNDTFMVFVDNGDGTATFTSADGASTLTVCTDCASSTVVDNGDGTYTATNPDGTEITWAAGGTGSTSVMTVTDNGDGTSTIAHDPGDGSTPVTATVCSTCTDAVDNGDGTITINNPDGTTVTACSDCAHAEAVQNADGSVTITNPDLTTVEIPAPTGSTSALTVVDNGDGSSTLTHDAGDGSAPVAVTVCTDCDHATAVQNADGSVTITNPDGTTVNVAAPTGSDGFIVPQTLAYNTTTDELQFVYLDPNGNAQTLIASIPVPSDCCPTGLVFDPATGDLTLNYTVDGLPASFVTNVPVGGTDTFVTFVDNTDGTGTLTSADGASTLDVCLAPCSSGGAVVTDNTDNTTTVTGTAPDGTVTEDVVLNNLLVNSGVYGESRDVDPAADIFLTEADVTDGTDVDPATVSPVLKVPGVGLAIAVDPPSSIKLTKTQSTTGPYFEGQQIDYVFVVENTGADDLVGVTVTDPLLTVVGGPIALASGAVDGATFTGSYVVTAADVANGVIYNTAETSGTDPDGNVVVDDDSDLAFAQECTNQVVCGYTGSLTNTASIVSNTFDPATDTFSFVYDSGATMTYQVTSFTGADPSTWDVQVQSTGTATNNRWRLEDNGANDTWEAVTTLTWEPTANGCIVQPDRYRHYIADLDFRLGCTTIEDVQTSEIPTILNQTADVVVSPFGVDGTQACIIDDPNPDNYNPDSSVRLTVTVSNGIVQGHQIESTYDWGGQVRTGDNISVFGELRHALAVDVTVDCQGNFISAVDINGNPVAEADITLT